MKRVGLELGLQVLVKEKVSAARGNNCESRLGAGNEHIVGRSREEFKCSIRR